MTSRERMARATRHEEADRVPVMCQLALGHYFLHAGVPAHRIWCTSVGKPGGGYILSAACSVAPRVEPWKLELLTPLPEEFGRY